MTGVGQREDVQDVDPAATDDDEMLLVDDSLPLVHAVEHGRSDGPDEILQNYAQASNKRRRIDDITGSIEPARATHATPARFILPQPAQNALQEAPSISSRPSFLRPSTQAQEPTEPLPDAFSPHKRGRQFIPGAMAAELQSWILEAGNAAVQSRRGKAYLKGEDYSVTISADEVAGEGPIFVKGQTSDGVAEQAMLIVERDRAGSKKVSVEVGDVVGIHDPTWRVNIMKVQWVVGVDWKILSSA